MNTNTLGVKFTRRTRVSLRTLTPYLLLAPPLTLVGLFFFYPVIQAIRLSFTKYYLLSSMTPEFIGLGNYAKLLRDDKFHRAMLQTVYWVVGCNVAHVGLGLGFALFMNRTLRLRGLWRGLFLIPWIVPVAAMGILWQWMYNVEWGLINLTLLDLGLLREPVDWLGDKRIVWFSVVFADGWKNYGFMYICFLAALQGIPRILYEAAQMDGAGRWGKFVHVTLPGLRPVMSVVVLLGLVWTFNEFNVIWLLTRGGPGYDTTTYGPLIYLQAFKFYRFGYASTIGILGFTAVIVLAYLYLKRMEIR